MPHCYFVNDYKQAHQDVVEEEAAGTLPGRASVGLPEGCVVYACSNQVGPGWGGGCGVGEGGRVWGWVGRARGRCSGVGGWVLYVEWDVVAATGERRAQREA